MEKFSGNGAECMVQFIKDGCKGSVCRRAPEGKGTAPVLVNRHIWENAYATDHLGWLAHPCEYYPPEPVYVDATPGQALDAWLVGKEVQVQVWLDEKLEGTEIRWDTVLRVPTERASHWDVRRTYRIRKE